VADLLVVTGPPGAGKSTVAERVSAAFSPAALVRGDDFFTFWTQGAIPPWLPEAREQNEVILRAAAAACGTFVRGGCTVVYDGVLGPWFLPTFTAATGLSRLHYAVLLPSVDRCLERVAGRTGHTFTDPTATAQLHADFAGVDIAPRHLLEVSDEDPAEVARLLLGRYREGALSHSC
jgi:predicted ABC-type ATPase